MEASAIHAPARLERTPKAARLLRLRSDDQLVALFRMGYDEAFGVIHDRYHRRLLAYARQMLAGSRSDAEDALQDVFLRAYAALRQDNRPVTLRAWLYRVAHNRCIDQLRRPVPAPAELFELSRPPLPDTPGEAEQREELRRLVVDVQRLPEQQRSALLMRELEGLSYAELADALGVSVGAVKSLLVRARLGLVAATEARDAACMEIRSELSAAVDRRARLSARSRRHLCDCAGCRDYRRTLQATREGLAALAPGPGPLASLAKLLGLGGAGSGAGVAAGAGGSAAALGGGAATLSASKVVAVVCCAAVMGGGAAEVRDRVAQPAPQQPAAAEPRAATAPSSTPAWVARRPASARAPTRPTALRRGPASTGDVPTVTAAAPGAVVAPHEEALTGGAMAPDESAPAPAPSDPTAPVEPAASPAEPAPQAPDSSAAPAEDAPVTTADDEEASPQAATAAPRP